MIPKEWDINLTVLSKCFLIVIIFILKNRDSVIIRQLPIRVMHINWMVCVEFERMI